MKKNDNMQFMFWHSDCRPEPIKGVICEQSDQLCTCGARTHDYHIPKKLMKKWREHCADTGFGWKH